MRHLTLGVSVLALSLAVTASAQSINYTDMALRSTGGAAGSDWNLWSNGYAGTFIHLDQPGTVQITVDAAGQNAGGAWPAMDLYVGDQKTSYTVSSSTYSPYVANVSLPAGTHLIRTQFNNDFYSSATSEDRNLLLRSLSLNSTGTNLTIVNPTTPAALKQTVFDASDSYIENYRKSSATVTVLGANGSPVAANTPVHVHLTNNAFSFGTAVAGVADSPAGPGWQQYMNPSPAPGSESAKYQSILASHFNMVVPENAGKWGFVEPVQNQPNLSYINNILTFAQDHNMRARMHNVLWSTNDGAEPQWELDLKVAAAAGDPAAKAALSSAISNRIQYVASQANGYTQLDGINESYHQSGYQSIYGPAGVADIYNQAINATRATGSDAHVFFNEYDVLDNGSDTYGSWYRDHIKSIMDAGITPANQPRLGIGIQYYTRNDVHDPARIYQTLNNLSGMDLPMTLTEFGVDGGDSADAPQILADTLRLVYGTRGTTGFLTWGFWKGAMWMNGAALYDEQWNITEAGKVWEQMMGIHNWGLANVPTYSTDLTLLTDANGRINFRGFLGDYQLDVGTATATMSLSSDTPDYSVSVPEPTTLALPASLTLLLLRRKRNHQTP